MLDFYQSLKSGHAATVPSIIYTDFESSIKKVCGYEKNPEESRTAKVAEHIPCGFSISTISSFKGIKYKYDVYRGEDYMKEFYKSLKEHAVEIIKFEKRQLIHLKINTVMIKNIVNYRSLPLYR